MVYLYYQIREKVKVNNMKLDKFDVSEKQYIRDMAQIAYDSLIETVMVMMSQYEETDGVFKTLRDIDEFIVFNLLEMKKSIRNEIAELAEKVSNECSKTEDSMKGLVDIKACQLIDKIVEDKYYREAFFDTVCEKREERRV